MADVFISYNEADRIAADLTCKSLEEGGITCWIAPRDVPPGRNFPEEIVDAIKRCKVMVVLLSPKSAASPHVLSEAHTAFSGDCTIVPVRIGEVEPNLSWRYYLGALHWLDAFPNVPQHMDELRILIRDILGREVTAAERDLARKRSEALMNLEALREKYTQTRISLPLSLVADPRYIDRDHRYLKVKRVDVLNILAGGNRSYRWLTVRNESDSPTYHLDHQESGENKVFFKDMQVICKDAIDGEERNSVRSMTAVQPNFVQVIRLFFPEALPPGHERTIFYKLDWPGELAAYWEDELSQSISLTRYALGVDELDFSVFDNRRVLDADVIEIDDVYSERPYPRPALIEPIDRERELKAFHGKQIPGARLTVAKPTGVAYRIVYRLESESSVTVEDLF